MLKVALSLLSLISSLGTNLVAQSPSTKLDASAIYDMAVKSVVLVVCGNVDGSLTQGSGVILRSDGLIATNFHVCGKSTHGRVKLRNGDIYDDVSIVESDELKDISLLKIKAMGLPALKLGNSDSLRIGQNIYAIGAPLGLEGSITQGIISSVRPVNEMFAWADGFRIIQISTPVTHGSSGCPLVNDFGEVVGLVFAGRSEGQNLNAAIPINYVSPLIASAKDGIQLAGINSFKPSAPKQSAAVARKPDPKADEVEYGSLADLRGVKKVYIDTGSDTVYRDHFIKEFSKAKLGLVVLGSADGADCIIVFRNELINEVWFSGSTAVVEKSLGQGMIFLPGTSQTRTRLLYKFKETKDTWFEKKPYVKFAQTFIQAYKDANR